MKQFKSVSEKRLIVDCIINSIHAYFLIDTGASIGLIDDNKMNRYKLIKGKKYNGTIVGAGGEISSNYLCDSVVYFDDKPITQFVMADISGIIKSIKAETGYDILGIISLPQMKILNMQIDTNDNLILLE